MLPHEFLAAIDHMPVFIIPTGLLEWHGDHLPLGVDALKVQGICLRIAEKLNGGIVLPLNYIGRPGFSRYIGTLTYSEGLVNQLFYEYMGQLRKVGARIIALITGHYGDTQVDCVKLAAKCFAMDHTDVTVIAGAEYEDSEVDGTRPADHGGFWETSMMLRLRPELVDMDLLKPVPNPPMAYPNPPHDTHKETNDWSWPDNVARSTGEMGERAIDIMATTYANKIRTALQGV